MKLKIFVLGFKIPFVLTVKEFSHGKDEFLEAAEKRDTILCDNERRVVMPLISFNRVSAVINIENDNIH